MADPDEQSTQTDDDSALPDQSELEQNRRRAKRKLAIFGVASIFGLSALAYFWPRRWRYIVVHHSAGNYGNIEFLQEVHRQRQAKDPIDAIPYHYVIGNGNGLGEGEIASDFRGQWHIWGAHVSARNPMRNYYGIGICLIGNFEDKAPSQKQYQALVQLTRSLMAQYQILPSQVSGHGYTPKEQTLCPGKHFPMQQFLRDIA